MNSQILVVDDDVNILKILKTLLEREGFNIVVAENSDDGLSILRQDEINLILSDIVMRPNNGITFLRQIRELNPDSQVIMMTGFATIETATKALKLGAFDYICKPFKIEELLSAVRRAATYALRLAGEEKIPEERKKILLIKQHYQQIVGESKQMKTVYDMIERHANTEVPVLIMGESGTGKSLVARAIHNAGDRQNYPFLTLSCAVWPERFLDTILFGCVKMPTDDEGNVVSGLPIVKRGLFELTKGGTLYFEQIDALPMDLQHKLLAVLKEKKFCRTGSTKDIALEVRIVADTVEPLENKMKKNDFLETLYSFFNRQTITLSSLEEREGDLVLLINHFLIQFNRLEKAKISIDKRARQAIEHYCWPGHVHELRTAIFRAAQTCKRNRIKLDDLPVPVRMCFMKEKTSIFGYSDEIDLRWMSLRKFLKSKEKDYLDEILRITKGSREKAAELLGISVKTFNSKYGND